MVSAVIVIRGKKLKEGLLKLLPREFIEAKRWFADMSFCMNVGVENDILFSHDGSLDHS
jgi:hypothetical protein